MISPELTTGFALNDVLVDARPVVRQAYEGMVWQERQDRDRDLDGRVYDVLNWWGLGVGLQMRYTFNFNEADRLAALFWAKVTEADFGKSVLRPGATESLKRARGFGNIAVLSSMPQEQANALCEQHGITDAKIIGGLYRPREMAAALRELGAHVYVGSETDELRSARTAGIRLVIGVSTGRSTEDELMGSHADEILPTLETFPEVLEKYTALGVEAAQERERLAEWAGAYAGPLRDLI